MADYYTSIVDVYECTDAELATSIKAKLEMARKFVENTKDESGLVGHLDKVDGVSIEFYNHFRDMPIDVIPELLGCTEFDEDGHDYPVFSFASEDAILSAVGAWLHFFYADTHPGFKRVIDYAYYCSKLRQDGFGGGVLAIDNDGYKVLDARNLYDAVTSAVRKI